MALGQQADQHPLDQLVLADDDPLDLEDRPLQGVDLLREAAVALRRRTAGRRGRGPRKAGCPARARPWT